MIPEAYRAECGVCAYRPECSVRALPWVVPPCKRGYPRVEEPILFMLAMNTVVYGLGIGLGVGVAAALVALLGGAR